MRIKSETAKNNKFYNYTYISPNIMNSTIIHTWTLKNEFYNYTYVGPKQ